MSEIKNQVLSGFWWRAIEQYSVQAAQFVIGIILARILDPHDFGLIALVMVLVNFGQVLIDGGFSNALIQTEQADEACCSSVFLCNVVVGIVCAVSLSGCAPWIARFYHEPQLLEMIPTLSLNFFISSCGLVYAALLVRKLRFKSLAKVSVFSTAISGTVGVVLALHQFGVWSLVGQALAVQLARLFGLWTFAVWRPRVWFEWAAIKKVAPFGSRVLLAILTESLYENMNVIAIGKLFTPTTLGFYSRADNLWRMTMSNFSSIVSSVAFPILSTIKHHPERLKRALKSAVEVLAFISYPAAVGLIAVAHPLVLTLLTRKWEPCVPFLQLLGGVWALYPLHTINLSVLLAQGHSREYLRVQLVKKAICLGVLPLLFWGIYPFIFGQIVFSLVSYYLNCHYSGKFLQYPLSAQLRDSLPYIGSAVLMGLCIQSVRFLHLPRPIFELVLELALGLASYTLFCWWFRLPALAKVVEILRNFRAQNNALKPVAAPVVT